MTNSLAAGKREHGARKIEADYLGVRYFVLKCEREIATAGFLAAIARMRIAMPITCSIGPMEEPPAWATSCSCAGGITG